MATISLSLAQQKYEKDRQRGYASLQLELLS